jgi:hypothetical protein
MRDVLTFFGALAMPVSVYLTGEDFSDGATGARAANTLDELLAGAVGLAAAVARDDARELGPDPLGVRAKRRERATA